MDSSQQSEKANLCSTYLESNLEKAVELCYTENKKALMDVSEDDKNTETDISG